MNSTFTPAEETNVGRGCVLRLRLYDGDPVHPCENNNHTIPEGSRDYCDLGWKAWTHPVIVVDSRPSSKEDREMMITFVRLTAIASRKEDRERLISTKIGSVSQVFAIEGEHQTEYDLLGVKEKLNYTFNGVSNGTKLEKNSFVILDHWHTLPLSAFENFNCSSNSKACDYRLDKRSYLHLMEQLRSRGFPAKLWSDLYGSIAYFIPGNPNGLLPNPALMQELGSTNDRSQSSDESGLELSKVDFDGGKIDEKPLLVDGLSLMWIKKTAQYVAMLLGVSNNMTTHLVRETITSNDGPTAQVPVSFWVKMKKQLCLT